MRFGNLAFKSGRSVRRGLTVAARAAACLLAAGVLTAPSLEAQGTPAGTVIRSWAFVTYQNANAQQGVATSDTVSLLVGQVAGTDVEPPRSSSAPAGTAVVFAHTLANVGNGADSFNITAVSSHGWPVTLYRDGNANGILDAADSLVSGPVALGYGGSAPLLARVAVPNLPGVPGLSDTVTVTATSRFDAAASDLVRDRLDAAAPVTITLAKRVDRPTALTGDILTYTLTYTAGGLGTASDVQVMDTIPSGTSYVPGTLRWNGTPLSDAAGDDAGSAGSGAVTVSVGTLASGATGSLSFQVQVAAGPARTVANLGSATFAWAGGAGSSSSNTVQTGVLVPALSLEKELTSAPVALIGQQVHYTLRYGNGTGASTAQNAVLTDTLPAGLEYVSATPSPAVSGQVLTWTVGDLAAGQSGAIDVVAAVVASLRDTVRVRNLGVVQAQGLTPVWAASAELTLVGPPSASLGLDLSADVLQVRGGEAIPYTVTLHNTGIVPLTDLQIDGRLPAGARYAPGSAVGADSGVVVGGRLILFTGAPLAPGASRTLRYVAALASPVGTVAEHRAIATGQASTGQAVSPEAIAWVQIRRDWPMETRAAIGKVWVDVHADSVQGADDAGIAGIDIWTEDGQVATTDETGKFSFTNLRPGRHAFRVDPRSLPPDYEVAGQDIQVLEASGWTTPRVDFRVVPLAPRSAEVRRPVVLTFSAAPLRAETPRAGNSLRADKPVVRYDATVRNPSRLPLTASLTFEPLPDSALVLVGDSALAWYRVPETRAIPVPDRPGTDVHVVAWGPRMRDSATAFLKVGQVATPVRVPVDMYRPPVTFNAWRNTGEDSLPAATKVAPGAELEVALDPTPTSWPGVAYALADGWRPVPGSVWLGATRAADPVVTRDAAGQRWLRWRFAGAARAAVTLRLRAGMLAADTERVTVHAARSAAEREAEQSAAFLRGPLVAIFAPADGAVLASDKVYIGVKGEPNATVVVYDGATPIDTAQTRIDGILDLVAVPLARGPHRVRVAMRNSWGKERWDSIAVHVTGLPARFEVTPSPAQLVADGRSTAALNVRVLDSWGVPVAQPAYVTVRADGADPQGQDADPSSVGLQLLSRPTGRLAIELRSGREVGAGVVELKSGDATAKVSLQLLPEVRALTVTGSGMVGVGASPDAYGAITARGRLDERTSLTLGVDTRRLNAGRDGFGRVTDPLQESQYPIFGDASRVETRTSSRNWLSARVERGFDWAAFGDLSTTDFAKGLTLAQYRRAVTGLAGSVSKGAFTGTGFGTLTSQALRQLLLRGAGVSGPYQLGSGILPGSDWVRIETRDLSNPERTVTTQGMTRYVDYQIDYETGVVLFKQPIPATDGNGNPVFIMATFEAASGGAQQLVAGARGTVDLRQLKTTLPVDSLRIGITGVAAQEQITDYRLVGTDVRALRVGRFDVGAELAYAMRGDSAGLATAAKASFGGLDGALTLGAGYMRVGREFTNPSNVALRPGMSEVTLKGGYKLGTTELRLAHSRQEFQLQGVDRTTTRVGIAQSLSGGAELDAGVVNDRIGGTASPSASTAAEFKAKWGATPKLSFWTEARRHLSLTGQEVWPDLVGVGGSYKVTSDLAVEASQRFVSRPDSQGEYSISSVGLRADVGAGTQAWGSYQLAGGVSGASNAAIVGLRNRLQVTPALTLNTTFERRLGVSHASAGDPVRALPFMQAEEDYWSAGAGVEYLPQRAPYRLSARGEYKDGAFQSTRLVSMAGDVALDKSLALLSRQDFLQNERPGTPLSRRISSLWGLAFRPARTDQVNVLTKLQWTDDRNPLGGGVLVNQGDERKLIGAAEVIWTPLPRVELGTRYAMRRTRAVRLNADGTSQPLTSWADYLGGRANYDLNRWLSARGDARLLMERTSGTTRWDGAPALALRPVNGLEFASGYRFGDLTDPDFSVRGGHGFFVTLQASVTERSISSVADFWRNRLNK